MPGMQAVLPRDKEIQQHNFRPREQTRRSARQQPALKHSAMSKNLLDHTDLAQNGNEHRFRIVGRALIIVSSQRFRLTQHQNQKPGSVKTEKVPFLTWNLQ